MGSIMGSVSMQSLGVSRAERLSAFVDGESVQDHGPVTDEVLTRFLREFGEDDRALWADYHLVGDVLKSEDLAVDPAAEHAFLKSFSAAFAGEPALLAPNALKANRSAWRARRFMPTLAAAAAVVMLTWVLVPRQMHSDVPAVGAMQTAAVPGATVQGAAQSAMQAVPQMDGTELQRVALAASSSGNELETAAPVHDDVNMIRDAQLDQYLDAHQQFAQRPVPQSVPLVRVTSASPEQ
jgi:sigma-E factor negative regulatory protein RseA